MNSSEYIEANRQRWNQLTLEHEYSDFYDLEGFRQGKDNLRPIELAELGEVAGKSLLHLQCHFGMDTLAWARRGAVVTGMDFFRQAIDLARSLSDELNIPAQFVCCPIDDLPEHLAGQFDIVFTSYGVIHGLPDISRWGQVIGHFVRPGGIFYMVEDHPFFRALRAGSDGVIVPQRSYFYQPEPQRIEATGSYATSQQGSSGVAYIWDHSLGSIINSLIQAGLTIESLHEFPYTVRDKFPFMQKGDDGWWRLPPDHDQHRSIPFLFSLQARKP